MKRNAKASLNKVYNGNGSLDLRESSHQLRDIGRWSNRLGKREKSVWRKEY
jgi:hypothetical protein